MRIERISENGFEAIADKWQDLLNKSNAISPMLTWNWCFSWWQSYKKMLSPCGLYVLAIYNDEDVLAGIVPCYIKTVRKYGVKVRKIMFFGTGEPEEAETCSEFLDFIVLPGHEGVIAEKIAEYLLEDNGWDEISFLDVIVGSDSIADKVSAFILANGKSIYSETINSGRCPFVKLPKSWDEYFESLGKRTKKLIRYERNRMEKQTDVEFVVIDGLSDIQLELVRFKALHEQRWAKDGKSGCFASSEFNKFIDGVLGSENILPARGKMYIQFFTLLINGDMAASFLLFRFKERLFFYNSAVDIDKYGKLSPGTVGLSYVIESAIKSGDKEFHFFKGRAGSYKDKWTDDFVEVSDVVIGRRNLRWRVRRGVDVFKNAVVRVYKR